MKPIKGRVMTQAEEVRELRKWLRDEATKNDAKVERLHTKIDRGNAELHRKMDDCNRENQQEHKVLTESIGRLDTKSGINTAKIGLFVTLLTIFVAAVASSGFAHLAGS